MTVLRETGRTERCCMTRGPGYTTRAYIPSVGITRYENQRVQPPKERLPLYLAQLERYR